MNEALALIAQFDVPSIPGTERQVVDRVAAAIGSLLPSSTIDRMKTAVAEAVMNAIEHGNQGQAARMVHVDVQASDRIVTIVIGDQGRGEFAAARADPNLEAKLAGLESPRGWGLFLIRNMVDEMNVTSDGAHHAVELIFYRERNESNEQQIA